MHSTTGNGSFFPREMAEGLPPGGFHEVAVR
jgi:hypothetical protein